MISSMHGRCLFSVLPQLSAIDMMDSSLTISAFRCSRFMRSIISFELDEDCILPRLVNDDDLFFPQSSCLTHIRVTLFYLAYPALRRNSNAISRIASVNICFLFDISIN